jgi:hydrogenase/urease accessory protein HupE
MSRAAGRSALFATAALAALLAPSLVAAHGLEPALLALRETAPGRYEVSWKSSLLRLPGARVYPALPERCRALDVAPTAAEDGDRVLLHWNVDCGTGGLAGATIGVDDLAVAKIDALVRIEPRDGEPIQTILTGRTPSFVVPQAPSRWEVLSSYAGLGISHILSGPDHLLFVFGLLLLCATPRRLVQTITAFTLGHSLTLSAAALGLTAVPARPIEVLIALSVLLLAVELAREAGSGTLLRQAPWAMALGFGLLHGFGFAGALREAGLPAGEVPLALLAFNVGIEVGQLAFVAAILAAGVLAKRWLPGAVAQASRPAVYAMGVLAAFWCFERLAVWLA